MLDDDDQAQDGYDRDAVDAERERAQLLAKQAEEQAVADLRWMMQQAECRRFLWDLLADAGVFRGSYNGNPNDTIYNEGRRSLGLSRLALLTKHCPEALTEMLMEHRDAG